MVGKVVVQIMHLPEFIKLYSRQQTHYARHKLGLKLLFKKKITKLITMLS